MLRVFMPLLAVFVLGACGASNPVNSSDESSAAAKPVATPAKPSKKVIIAELIPYQKGAPIAKNILSECTLNEQLSKYIQSYSAQQNVAINRVAGANMKARGNMLMVEITDAVSSGNAFIGHRKFVKISGTLYNNSKKVASFTGARISGGGFWGGFKGSCDVLERTVNTLGKDIAQWLTNPIDGMHLGDGI